MAVVCLGQTVESAMEVESELKAEYGIAFTLINARFVKPLDRKFLCELLSAHKTVITVEDHAVMGGFGSAFLEIVSELNIEQQARIVRLGIEDRFIDHGTQEQLREIVGVSSAAIKEHVLRYSELESVSAKVRAA